MDAENAGPEPEEADLISLCRKLNEQQQWFEAHGQKPPDIR